MDERNSGAGSGGGDRELSGFGGGQRMMEVQAAGYTRESLFLCIYYFILINSILLFILFDHPF